jgi:nucleoside-diphosphate-sugar epimerase
VRAPPDVRRGFADIEKAKRIVGYKPKYSIKEGMTDLVEHYPVIQKDP